MYLGYSFGILIKSQNFRKGNNSGYYVVGGARQSIAIDATKIREGIPKVLWLDLPKAQLGHLKQMEQAWQADGIFSAGNHKTTRFMDGWHRRLRGRPAKTFLHATGPELHVPVRNCLKTPKQLSCLRWFPLEGAHHVDRTAAG
jgi:hypothetical protein